MAGGVRETGGAADVRGGVGNDRRLQIGGAEAARGPVGIGRGPAGVDDRGLRTLQLVGVTSAVSTGQSLPTSY